MEIWSEKIEEEFTFILKEWLKHQGKTQADLRRSLKAESTRMPAIIEVIKREYKLGGLPRVASILCSIEKDWSLNIESSESGENSIDRFGQLDLLMQKIRDDCKE